MTKRREFTPKTKRLILERSEGRCEACGFRYGLPQGKRCNAPLTKGKYHFEHIHDAGLGGGNEVENGLVICDVPCHQHKTNLTKAETARSKRLEKARQALEEGEEKAANMPRRKKHKWPSQKIPSRPFRKSR